MITYEQAEQLLELIDVRDKAQLSERAARVVGDVKLERKFYNDTVAATESLLAFLETLTAKE